MSRTAPTQKQAEPAIISSLTFTPPPGCNLQRAVAMAEQLAIEYQGAVVVFRFGYMEVSIRDGGAL